MPHPRFEPVSECSICGNDFYESDMVRHYKTNRLVDRLCADEPGASDYLEKMRRPVEHQKRAKQPVPKDENGFDQSEWATVEPKAGAGTGATATIVGNKHMGIVTLTAGENPVGGFAPIFNIVFENPYPHVPNFIEVKPWDPHAEQVRVVTGVPNVGFLEVLIAAFDVLQTNVTYQWRYEIR